MELQKTVLPGLIKFQALKESADGLAAECVQVKVTDDVTEAIGSQIIVKAKNFSKVIEAKRVELKAPSKKEGEDIDAAAKYIVEELKKAIESANKQLLAFKERKENDRLAEMHRINQLKLELGHQKKNIMQMIDGCKDVVALKSIFVNYIKTFPTAEIWQDISGEAETVLTELKNYGSAKKQILTNPEKEEELKVVQAEIAEAIEEVAESAGEVLLADSQANKTTGLRTNFKQDIVNFDEIPRQFLMVNEAKVKAFHKEERDAGRLLEETIIYGIRFYPEKSLSGR